MTHFTDRNMEAQKGDMTCSETHDCLITANSKTTFRRTRYKDVNPRAWSLALSRSSGKMRRHLALMLNVFVHLSVVRRGGCGFQLLNNAEPRIRVLLLPLEKHYLPPHEEKSTCPVSYKKINVHRRNVSETSSQGNTNSWHVFNRAGLRYRNCTAAKNHWKDVWNWRKGNWRGRIKEGSTNLKVIKELGRELKRGNALPKSQRGRRRKGNAEDKTRGISNLG